MALRQEFGLDASGTLMSIGVQVATYRQLKDAIAFLKQQGLRFIDSIPFDLHPGIDYAAHAIGPDGHCIELYHAMEQIGWDGRPRPAAQRRRVDPDWPQALDASPDTYADQTLQGPLGGDEATEHLIRDHSDGVDLDQIVRRRHLADLDHGRGRRRRLEILAPHFVDLVEVLHVAHVDVDPADVVHGAAGLLDRGLEVLADLPRLRLDIADAGNRAVGPPRRHAGNEHQAAARLDHGRVGEMPARLADLRRA